MRGAFRDGGDRAARSFRSRRSLFSGLALANARLGAVHGLAAPLGGEYPAPHGFVCARLLPVVMEANVRALSGRDPAGTAMAAFAEVGRILAGPCDMPGEAAAWAGVRWVKELCDRLGAPPLSDFGMDGAAVPGIAAKGLAASSMRGNPVQLSQAELEGILQAAL